MYWNTQPLTVMNNFLVCAPNTLCIVVVIETGLLYWNTPPLTVMNNFLVKRERKRDGGMERDNPLLNLCGKDGER